MQHEKVTSLIKVDRDRGLLRTPTSSVNLALSTQWRSGARRDESVSHPLTSRQTTSAALLSENKTEAFVI